MKTDKLYLTHMNDCLGRILSYVADGRQAFMQSTLIQDAVIRNLQILAESPQRVSDDLKSAHPEVDWRGMAGFRNVLVHDYLTIDLVIVWNVIEGNLPELQRHVAAILTTFDE